MLQATGQEGSASLADNARRIARTIAERHRSETSVILLITQAETLHSKTLRLLQAMAPYFAEHGAPTLQVVFVGRPAFRSLLDGRGMTPLREALGLPASIEFPQSSSDDRVSVSSAVNDQPERPEPAPATPPAPFLKPGGAALASASAPETPRRSISVRWLLLFAVVLMAIGLASLSIPNISDRNVPARTVPVDVPPAEPQPRSEADPAASPSPHAPASDPSVPPTPMTPLPVPAPKLVSPGRVVPSITVAPALPPALLRQSHGDSATFATLDPRIVIHVPAGSEGAAALSAHLLASLSPRPGTVEARRVPDTPNRPTIRYFHPEDEPTARQVAAWMADTGLPWTLRDFSTFQPRPSRGTIEVWLPRQ